MCEICVFQPKERMPCHKINQNPVIPEGGESGEVRYRATVLKAVLQSLQTKKRECGPDALFHGHTRFQAWRTGLFPTRTGRHCECACTKNLRLLCAPTSGGVEAGFRGFLAMPCLCRKPSRQACLPCVSAGVCRIAPGVIPSMLCRRSCL